MSKQKATDNDKGYGLFNPKPDAPPPPLPTIPVCDGDDCFEKANPAWSDGTKTYCRNCAPDELKRPRGRCDDEKETPEA